MEKKYFDGNIIRNSLANTPQITFEITDACNLDCVYCGYGKLYGNHDERVNKQLDIGKAIRLLDYMQGLWESSLSQSHNNAMYLSFYGGEPLLNMSFIKAIVDYSKRIKNKNRKILYSMTTNGLLLNKYMDFLVDNEFSLLISLDGDEYNNSYRISKNGKESYNNIIDNVELIRIKYPDYFNIKVNFNAVLHNRNSVAAITDYFKKRYGKVPSIGALNDMGIRPEMQDEFLKMYRNSVDSLMLSENYGELENELFLSAPTYRSAAMYLLQHSEFKYNDYNELMFGKPEVPFVFPTGTCVPFAKRVFVTVNGKILPCERIGHQFALGHIDNDKVHLDFDGIAEKFNSYFSKIDRLCAKCYNTKSCVQCIFNLDTIDDEKCICHGFMNKEAFLDYENAQMGFFARHPEAYAKIMNDVIYK
jgi:uncharacterized protein